MPSGLQGQSLCTSLFSNSTRASPAAPPTAMTGMSTARCTPYTSRGCGFAGGVESAGCGCCAGAGGVGGTSSWPAMASSSAAIKAFTGLLPQERRSRCGRRCVVGVRGRGRLGSVRRNGRRLRWEFSGLQVSLLAPAWRRRRRLLTAPGARGHAGRFCRARRHGARTLVRWRRSLVGRTRAALLAAGYRLLDYRVHLPAHEQDKRGDQEPGQKHDDAADRAIGEVVAAEVRHVRAKTPARQEPNQPGRFTFLT